MRIRGPADSLRYVVEKGSIAVDGVSLTVAAVDDDALRGLADPGDARAHDARRRPRRARPVNLEVDVIAKYVEKLASRPCGAHERTVAVQHHRGGARGHPRRPDGRGLRRRGPRERGRPDAGGPVRHARGDQLHGHARPRPDLPGAHPRALRRARPRPDGGQERVRLRDRLHRLDRGPRGRHDRHLGARPRAHDPGGDRPARRGRATSSSRATSSRSRRSRAACSSAPARPRRRSTSPGSPASTRPA